MRQSNAARAYDLDVVSLEALSPTLEARIAACVDDFRSELLATVQDALQRRASARSRAEYDARVAQIRTVLGLRSPRAADLLCRLVDAPDQHHSYASLTGLPSPVSEAAKNIVRVYISDIRSRLRTFGIDGVVINSRKLGYYIHYSDALRLQALWE